MKRIASIAILAGLFLLLSSTAALAYPLVNVPATYRAATINTIDCRPNLVSVVLGVWPTFYVQGGFGGEAWLGHIDVGTSLYSGQAYTNQVAHEWCHEVQRAMDEPGGAGSLTAAWHAFMAASWPQVNTTGWDAFTWNHTLMEAMRQAWWYPYYAGGPEYRVYADRPRMTAILQSCGVTP